MARSEKILTTFGAGVIGQEHEGRVDLAKAQAALRDAKNYVLEPYGSLTRRPGLQMIGYVATYEPPTFSVTDSITTSGTRGTDDWWVRMDITVSPLADPLSETFYRPKIEIWGEVDADIILYGVDLLDQAGNQVWASIFRPNWDEGQTVTGHEVWGPAGVQDLHPSGALQIPGPGDPEYSEFWRQPYTLTDGAYYRGRAYGQIDPSSAFGNFVYSRWFTLSGGFEDYGFTPP